MDMDDDAEDRRRLDRARVLVKTPWTPTIRHTVEVHIGDEHFKVFIVEECGGDTHACRRGRRSFCESSEEIDSDESYSGSSTPRSSLVTVCHLKSTDTNLCPSSLNNLLCNLR